MVDKHINLTDQTRTEAEAEAEPTPEQTPQGRAVQS
jgi:hypothetical protein